jgi:hypothetical protein
MKLEFDENMVLHICPESNIELMALKYWAKEYQTHGSKMLEIKHDASKYRKYKDKENETDDTP